MPEESRSAQEKALERKMPKIFDVENKLRLDSGMLSEVKDWKVGEDYRIELTITELASRELSNDNIEAEFEIKEAKAL